VPWRLAVAKPGRWATGAKWPQVWDLLGREGSDASQLLALPGKSGFMITKACSLIMKEPVNLIMRKKIRCSVRAVVLAGGASIAAMAQAAAQTAPPPKLHVEEVTVTAQKRSENVRKVPLSVTVLSGKAIKAAHIQNFADLTRAVPNLSFSSQAGAGLSTLELRGVASQAGTATVALYLDDVSLTTRNIYTQGTAEPRFLDISRVEVLRGPQGTLYGASALGGTLKYVTNQPQLDVFSGNIFSELSGTDHANSPNWDEQGVINIPLVDGKAALRVAGETGGDAGFIANINPATGQTIKSGINSTGFNVAHASMLLAPNDWLTITPSMFWQKVVSRDVDAQYLELPLYETPKTVAEPGHDSMFVPSITANADLGWANLISVTSGYFRSFRRTLDSTIYDNLTLYLCDPGNPAASLATCPAGYVSPKGLFKSLFNQPSYTFYDNQTRQFQQEVRLVSKPYEPGGLPFTWLVGAYYSDETSKATDNETVQGVDYLFNKYGASPSDPNVLFGTFPGAIVPDPTMSGRFANDHVYQGLQGYDTAQYAVFGEGTYYPMPNMRLTFGARYLYARDSEDSDEEQFYSYGYTGSTPDEGHFYAFTPKFAFGWDVMPDNTIYANASKGFRLGSENRAIVYVPTDANSPGTPSYDLAQLGLHSSPLKYGPDKLWNFEVGDKFRLFGGRIVGSADVFYILWNSIQQEIPLVTSGLDFETNAGNATSYGTEFELRGRVTDNLTAGVSGSYTHATLDDGVLVGNGPLIGTRPGEVVPGVPRFNFDFNGRQDFVVNDKINGFASFDLPWIGPSHGVATAPNADYERPSYFTFDAAVGADYGRWEFTLFGKNLTNNKTIIQRPDIQGSGVDVPGTGAPLYGFDYRGTTLSNTQGFTVRPLTVGVNASAKF
jgi:outer membrane receptor protein involved in Fe transport